MKFLLILAIVAWLAWRWRSSRIRSQSRAKSESVGEPTTMLCCDRCGLHLPARDTIAGKSGVYCCQEHLRQAEP
jgi:uncharacterized protein